MLPDGFRVRPAGESDAEAIYEFILALAEYESLLHTVSATRNDLRRWCFGENAICDALIAEQGATPVGFALFYPVLSTFRGRPSLFVEDLFVVPEHRGQGIGTALFRSLADVALERGWERLEWAVLQWNEPSIRFYQSLGARLRDGWDIYRLEGESLYGLSRQQQVQ